MKHGMSWWGVAKSASTGWKDVARSEGVGEDLISWAEGVAQGYAGALWLARMASTHPPHLIPGRDDEAAQSLILRWKRYGAAAGGARIDGFKSPQELEAAIAAAKERTLQTDTGSWNQERNKKCEALEPTATYAILDNIFACYVLDTRGPGGKIEVLSDITKYCVRHPDVGVRYHPDRYFLVTKNGSVMSLIHPESNENKGPSNDELTGCEAATALALAYETISRHGGDSGRSWVLRNFKHHFEKCKGGTLGWLIALGHQIGGEIDEITIDSLNNTDVPANIMSIVLANERGGLAKTDAIDNAVRTSIAKVRDKDFDIAGAIEGMRGDANAMMATWLWIYDDARRRKDGARVGSMAQILDNAKLPWSQIHTVVPIGMYNRVKKALEEIGASKAVAEMRSSEYRYLAMRSMVDKQRLQKDHHESRMLREADAHTLMWYYTHMARGMTTPNQQPHAGRPWPELENRIVEIVGEHPNVGRRMLRQYLQMVTQPEARLAAMMETANSAGLGEDFLKATPSEYRTPS